MAGDVSWQSIDIVGRDTCPPLPKLSLRYLPVFALSLELDRDQVLDIHDLKSGDSVGLVEDNDIRCRCVHGKRKRESSENPRSRPPTIDACIACMPPVRSEGPDLLLKEPS